MTLKEAPFTVLEFTGTDGKTRRFRGCSLWDLEEFQERIQLLKDELRAVDELVTDVLIRHIYVTNETFKIHCDRALELNGINPKWVNAEMLTQLLLCRVDQATEGGYLPGYLVELNTFEHTPTKTFNYQGIKVEPLTGKAALIASLAHQCKSIEEALRIAKSEPARDLLEIIDMLGPTAMSNQQRFEKEKEKIRDEMRTQRVRRVPVKSPKDSR